MLVVLAQFSEMDNIKEAAATEAFTEANSTACAQDAQFCKILGHLHHLATDKATCWVVKCVQLTSTSQMRTFWIPVMCGVNSSRMGFTRAVCCTSQPKLVLWSEVWGMKVSQLTASYSPSSVRFTCSFWGSWILFPALVQVNMICGGLKLLAQHSTIVFLFKTTSGMMMETSGGTVRYVKSNSRIKFVCLRVTNYTSCE